VDDFPERPDPPLRIAVSQCLEGAEVRYDGSGARSSWPHRELEGLFETRGICPELGIGMSVPREPIRLVGGAASYRVVGVVDPTIDKTDELRAFAREQVPTFGDLAGYVFMKNSPSCGLFRVKVYPPGGNGPARREGTGAYAATVIEEMPALPVEESGRLFDDVIRENFVTRCFAYAHWQLLGEEVSPRWLVEFHSRYKYLLMAHSVPAYQEAGRLLSDLREDLAEKTRAYITVLMKGFAVPATRKGHTNVLSHLQGYLKRQISSPERQELDVLIQGYRRGEQPLLAPLALLQHHFRRFPEQYVLNQAYLEPHPPAAGLRRPL
jgi:uncharacterized protein YbgA (DUF1722 family)/uncharacterized protein YbbK (DUF523 family)